MAIDDSERDDLLDRLAEEFAARLRRGERPSLKEYADRYPELADEIRELFPAMVKVEQAKEICHDWDEAERADVHAHRRCRRWATTGSSARSAAGAWGWSTRPSRSRSAAGWP